MPEFSDGTAGKAPVIFLILTLSISALTSVSSVGSAVVLKPYGFSPPFSGNGTQLQR